LLPPPRVTGTFTGPKPYVRIARYPAG